MTTLIGSVEALCDRDLLAHLRRAAAAERRATAELIALLMEMDGRRLYLAESCSSLFTYCTQVLHLSEHAAYGRIEAARAARRFATLLERLSDGSLNLTAVGLLAPHLTPANHLEVLNRARHKTKREVEQLVAQLNPKPDVQSVIRKLPHSKPESPREQPRAHTLDPPPRPWSAPVTGVQTRSADVKPLAPERYKIQFTADRETYERLRRVQDLVRHTIPNGDPAGIFGRALTLLDAELSKTKVAATDRPRAPHRAQPLSRHIPAVVKRAVWQRDGGRCAFSGRHGRCTETGLLEFHHVIPFAEGGETTSSNIELRCRAHNAYEAEQWFGPQHPPLLREQRSEYAIGIRARAEAVGEGSLRTRRRTNLTSLLDASHRQWRRPSFQPWLALPRGRLRASAVRHSACAPDHHRAQRRVSAGPPGESRIAARQKYQLIEVRACHAERALSLHAQEVALPDLTPAVNAS